LLTLAPKLFVISGGSKGYERPKRGDSDRANF
jgi:hypothetical protein